MTLRRRNANLYATLLSRPLQVGQDVTSLRFPWQAFSQGIQHGEFRILAQVLLVHA